MTTISVRIDEDTKKEAQKLFGELGLDLSTAINMFLRQSVREQGVPFAVTRSVPNAETLAALEEVAAMKKNSEGAGYSDVETMMKDILG